MNDWPPTIVTFSPLGLYLFLHHGGSKKTQKSRMPSSLLHRRGGLATFAFFAVSLILQGLLVEAGRGGGAFLSTTGSFTLSSGGGNSGIT